MTESKAIHTTDNGLYSIFVEDTGSKGKSWEKIYCVVNNETGVAEYQGTVLPNTLALASVFDSRLHSFNETGSIADREDQVMDYHPVGVAH